MPFVRITVLSPELSPQQIERLQVGTTHLMTSVMRKPIGGTSVLVEQVRSAGWSIAGSPIAVGAHVEATIGFGLNTTGQKAQFMLEMMNLLRIVLGPEVRDETYIVFHEFDHGSYGRGGLSRAERERPRVSA